MSRLSALVVVCVLACVAMGSSLTPHQQHLVNSTSRRDVNGWIWIRIAGSARDRGFQHGYSLAKEFKAAYDATVYMTYETTGMTYSFFAENGVKMQKEMIPEELLEEMSGIAEGLSAAGVSMTLDDVIGWNAFQDIAGYWWPTVRSQYASSPTTPTDWAYSHCSAFVATGSATADGRPVIGHTTFAGFASGGFMNVWLDITPEQGHRMAFQTTPGLIQSGTDFWIANSTLMVVETTIAGYFGFDATKLPEWTRVRMATQYADDMDDWVNRMLTGNNGAYANTWLLAHGATNRIAKLEMGLKYTAYHNTSDGFYYGDNVVEDPRIRNLECGYTGYSDVRQQTGARRTRWLTLLPERSGTIDAEVGRQMLADTYDVYLQKDNPGSRTICGMYDIDPQPYVSNPNAVWNVPFTPAGSVDGKVATAQSVESMSAWIIYGRANGVEFDADAFLKQHPQWLWQKPALVSRPSQPYLYANGTSVF